MEEIKSFNKIPVIEIGTYKVACFMDRTDVDKTLFEINDLNVPFGLLITKGSKNRYKLNIITDKSNMDARRIMNTLLEEGDRNGVYSKFRGKHTENNATCYANNINLIK